MSIVLTLVSKLWLASEYVDLMKRNKDINTNKQAMVKQALKRKNGVNTIR